jgi:hypothetical protein
MRSMVDGAEAMPEEYRAGTSRSAANYPSPTFGGPPPQLRRGGKSALLRPRLPGHLDLMLQPFAPGRVGGA